MSKESFGNIASWIPQVFYDLIGRIIPGSILLTLSYVILYEPSIDQTKQGFIDSVIFTQPQSLLVFEFILFSYFISTLLGGIWMFVSRKEWRDLPLKSMEAKAETPDQRYPHVSFLYDAIQYKFPSVGSRLAKLSAERHSARVLTIGLFSLSVAYILTHYPSWKTLQFYLVLGALILSAIFSYIFNLHIAVRSNYLMANHWHFLTKGVTSGVQQKKARQGTSADRGEAVRPQS